LKTDRLIELEIRAAVKADEWHAQHGKLDGELITLLAVRIVGWRQMAGVHVAVGKGCSVEFGRLVRLAMVKPQAGRNLLLGRVEARHDGSPYAWAVSRVDVKPPKIASWPFHGGGVSRMRGSCISAPMPASRVGLSGHSIQPNTTVSPSFA